MFFQLARKMFQLSSTKLPVSLFMLPLNTQGQFHVPLSFAERSWEPSACAEVVSALLSALETGAVRPAAIATSIDGFSLPIPKAAQAIFDTPAYQRLSLQLKVREPAFLRPTSGEKPEGRQPTLLFSSEHFVPRATDGHIHLLTLCVQQNWDDSALQKQFGRLTSMMEVGACRPEEIQLNNLPFIQARLKGLHPLTQEGFDKLLAHLPAQQQTENRLRQAVAC